MLLDQRILIGMPEPPTWYRCAGQQRMLLIPTTYLVAGRSSRPGGLSWLFRFISDPYHFRRKHRQSTTPRLLVGVLLLLTALSVLLATLFSMGRSATSCW